VQSSLFFSNYYYPLPPVSEKLLTSVHIRLATLDDINQIAEVLIRSFHNFSDLIWWLYPLMKLGVCEDLRNRFQADNPYYKCIVAVIPADLSTGTREQIIGTVELSVRTKYHWLGKEECPYLANLAVSKDYRRKGIGNKLLKHCDQITVGWGFQQIQLHVLADNTQAQELYWKNNYKIKQVETNLYSLFVTSQRRLLLTKSI
jgi:ribosomal protein S18 acetylase RimI-like enzyme